MFTSCSDLTRRGRDPLINGCGLSMEMEEEVSGEITRQETEYVEEGTLDEPILVTIVSDYVI